MNWVPLYQPLSDNWQPTRHTGCFGHMTLYRATSLVSNFCKAWNKQCLLNNYKISSYLSPAEKWWTKRCWKQQLTSTKSPKKDGTLVTFKNIFTKTWMTLTAARNDQITDSIWYWTKLRSILPYPKSLGHLTTCPTFFRILYTTETLVSVNIYKHTFHHMVTSNFSF